MKKIFFLPFMLLTLATYAQKKKHYQFDYAIVYQMTYQPDSNNKGVIRKEYMELLTNDSISLYRPIKTGILDSATYSEFEKDNLMGPSDISFITNNTSPITYKIVKEKQHHKLSTFDEISVANPIYYVEDLDDLKWEVKDDTLTISGQHCQRADLTFGNRNWIAWFAPEIPITDGPYKFSGLPGLIVKIADRQEHWTFTMLNLKKTKKEAVINFDERHLPIYMDKKEFFKQKRNYIDNAMQIEEASGRILFPDANSRELSIKNFKERAKRNNNWIELYKP